VQLFDLSGSPTSGSTALAPAISPPAAKRGLDRRYSMLGVQVDAFTMDELTEFVAESIRARARRIIANHNLHSVCLYQTDRRMRAFYARAAATFVDGMALVCIARLLGIPLSRRHRTAAIDWLHPLLDRACTEGWRVFVLAGPPGLGERARRILEARHPGLQMETAHGFFNAQRESEDSREVLARIRGFQPHLLMVGMGMPRQERWIVEHLPDIEANAILNVGCLMEYTAGDIPTPPRWLGRCGLEWCFRLVTTPRRVARRYLVESWAVLPIFLREWRAGLGVRR